MLLGLPLRAQWRTKDKIGLRTQSAIKEEIHVYEVNHSELDRRSSVLRCFGRTRPSQGARASALPRQGSWRVRVWLWDQQQRTGWGDGCVVRPTRRACNSLSLAARPIHQPWH